MAPEKNASRHHPNPPSSEGLSGLKKELKPLLHFFVFFHLVMISLIPNRSSFVNESLSPILVPYANLLGFNNSWQFFSPDPGPAAFLEYRVQSPSGLGQPMTFPPTENPYFLRATFNRRVAAIRMSSTNTDLVKKVIAPYLCRQNPEATELLLSAFTVEFPSLQAVASEHRPLNDTAQRRYQDFGNFLCPSREQGTDRGTDQ